MVAMEMADENPRHAGGGYLGEDKLPLGPFAGIEEEPLIVPTQKISALVAEACRLLTRTPQDNQVSCAHEHPLML